MVLIDMDNPTTREVLVPSDRPDFYKSLEVMFGVNFPFYVSDIKVDHDDLTYHLFVSYHNKLTFPSPCCGVENCKIQSKVQRVWRTLDFAQYKTYIHMNVPKVRCPKCNKISSYPVGWTKKSSRFTNMFEDKVLEFSTKMSLHALAKVFGESDKTLARIILTAENNNG